MFSGNGDVGKNNPREIEVFSAQPQQHFAATPAAVDGAGLRVRQILNKAAPFVRPFSFTSLLSADATEIATIDVGIQAEQQLDGIILVQKLSPRRLHRVAEESMVEKLKEKELELQEKLASNVELERRVMQYTVKLERLVARARYLEQMALSLQSDLQEAAAARCYLEPAPEDAELLSENPERVQPVTLGCRACERRMATVMILPCRHVCICMQCDAAIWACPVCLSSKTTSVKVYLPVN